MHEGAENIGIQIPGASPFPRHDWRMSFNYHVFLVISLEMLQMLHIKGNMFEKGSSRMETSWLAEKARGAVALQFHCPIECSLKDHVRGSYSFLVLYR